MEVRLGLLRRPRSSGWRKIMHAVSAKGASQYFEKKLDSLLDKVMKSRGDFCEHIHERRLQLATSKDLSTWTNGPSPPCALYLPAMLRTSLYLCPCAWQASSRHPSALARALSLLLSFSFSPPLSPPSPTPPLSPLSARRRRVRIPARTD